MSIKIKNLTKLFGEQKALDEVSIAIPSGEVVGLLGPNGAGKSTMMKIITCFIPPTSGEVEVCGYDIYEQSLEIRKKVGYLPENNPLYLDLYVREYMEFIAGMFSVKDRNNRIREMIEITGLGPEQRKKIGQLSKGYRQRVGLAQALIHDPEVLILDEPTSGLDPNQLMDIRQLIKTIGLKKTVLLSTHIMQEVEAVCDRAIIIDKGKIVADDTTGNLTKKVSGIKLIQVEFDKEIDESMFESIAGVIQVKKINKNHWEVQAENDEQVRMDIFQIAVDKNLKVLSMQKQEQNLEKVFQQLTRTN